MDWDNLVTSQCLTKSKLQVMWSHTGHLGGNDPRFWYGQEDDSFKRKGFLHSLWWSWASVAKTTGKRQYSMRTIYFALWWGHPIGWNRVIGSSCKTLVTHKPWSCGEIFEGKSLWVMQQEICSLKSPKLFKMRECQSPNCFHLQVMDQMLAKQFRLMYEKYSEICGRLVVDMDTCTLHVVHNGFDACVKACGSQTQEIALDLHAFF